MDTNTLEGQFELAEKLLARQLAWVNTADSKISPVFAVDAAMLAVMAALAPAPRSSWTVVCGIFAALAVVPLLVSIGCLVLTAFPRLSGPKGSVIFFGGINALSEDAFLKRLSQPMDQDMVDDLRRQVYRNAGIAAEKYRTIKWAMIAMFASIPTWLVAVWLLYSC